eukprot:1333347-Alexandrium_andersonii.AAC.1
MAIVMARPHIGSDSVHGALEGPLCFAVRAQREHGNENLPRPPGMLVPRRWRDRVWRSCS